MGMLGMRARAQRARVSELIGTDGVAPGFIGGQIALGSS